MGKCLFRPLVVQDELTALGVHRVDREVDASVARQRGSEGESVSPAAGDAVDFDKVEFIYSCHHKLLCGSSLIESIQHYGHLQPRTVLQRAIPLFRKALHDTGTHCPGDCLLDIRGTA